MLAALCVPANAAFAAGGPIMPLSQVQPGMHCTGETVVQGTTISSFNVDVIDVVEAPGEGARILVQVSGPVVDTTGVAEGYSGSPVYCPDSFGTLENAGAISEGIGQYGNNVVLVTPIEQMLGEPVQPPPDAPRLAARPRPLLGPLTVGGLSPAVFGLLQRAGARAGRLVLAAPAGQPAAFGVQPLVPGASVSASYSSGAVPMGAIGTVTYVDGPTVYAFGHELDGAGRRSLLLQDAYVYFVVNNPDPSIAPSYKLAVPGHTEGIVPSDTPNAVIGEVGAPPPTVPVDVTAHDLDTNTSMSFDTQVADETAIGLPLGTSLVDSIAPLEVAQAATEIYDGPPASESGRMCLRIYAAREPASRSGSATGTSAPGCPATPAWSLRSWPARPRRTSTTAPSSGLEQVDFAALHVARVAADMSAARGLDEATIVSARAPRRVRRAIRSGSGCSCGSTAARLRTVSFPVTIPSGARGTDRLTIHGPATPAAASTGGLSSSLVVALSGSGSGSGASPPGRVQSAISCSPSCARRSRRSRATTGWSRTCPMASSAMCSATRRC